MKKLKEFYDILLKHSGFLNWWPGDGVEEIIIGAILTQNTAWKNVEQAIFNLKKRNLIDFKRILKEDGKTISKLIKPAGYFNQKTKKLKKMAEFLRENPIEELKKLDAFKLREKLLKVWGIGRETADSIVLYAFERPIFVIDAYTKRIFSRHGLCSENIDYDELQKVFMENLPEDLMLYNDFHAQIVELGKNYCSKKKPKCEKCPVKGFRF